MPEIFVDRNTIVEQFRTLLTGWYKTLRAMPSRAVWAAEGGIKNNNFVSVSGYECDGISRLMPALAAWASQPDNPADLSLNDGSLINIKEVLRDCFIQSTDPKHAHWWGFAPAHQGNQRQVESSVYAWSLWLSRDWLMPTLSTTEIANIQAWLASCTVFTRHFSNWSMFTAVNHAARIALSEYGLCGDLDAIRRDLLPSEEVALADGWTWDVKYSGIDYYNFWVWGSHHCYLKAMLPNFQNPILERSLTRLRQRLQDQQYILDASGNNILFGRSLAYRWGCLTGLICAQYLGLESLDPGLSRMMLGRNIDAWLNRGSLHDNGNLRERLTPTGSDGSRESYINCGHPYWGMQAFLCLGFKMDHSFWTAQPKALPIDERDFLEPRQGPGLVFQGFYKTGEVRLFNLRNLDHASNPLYEKLVYSTAFPCNSDDKHRTLWDNQFGLLLKDGSHLTPQIQEIDTNNGQELHIVWNFKTGKNFHALVQTTIRIEGELYNSEHEIECTGDIPEDAEWIEGGFTLGHIESDNITSVHDAISGWAELKSSGKLIYTKILNGWSTLYCFPEDSHLPKDAHNLAPNIIYGKAFHYYAISKVVAGKVKMCSLHGATLSGEIAKAAWRLNN